jgi:hypothetical protein
MPLQLLDRFPSVHHAFAYGSGVFKQPGLYSDNAKQHEGPMVDLIFAVDDPVAWHKEVRRPSGGNEVAAATMFTIF